MWQTVTVRVFVIGASGFTGRRVLAACPSDWSTIALTRSPEATRVIEAAGALPARGDLDDPESVLRAMRTWQPDALICLASLGFGHAESLVEAIAEGGSPRCVFTSTTAIYTSLNPDSKQIRIAAEDSIRASGLPAVIVRPTMIYGRPGDRNMERLLQWLRRIPLVPAPGHGRALQQPVHVDDLAAAIVRAVETPKAIGQSVNLPGPSPLTFAEIVSEAAIALDRRARIMPLPTSLLRRVVSVQQRLLPRPRFRAEQIDRLVEDKAFDVTPARRLLTHNPRPFAAGIAQEVQLLRGEGL